MHPNALVGNDIYLIVSVRFDKRFFATNAGWCFADKAGNMLSTKDFHGEWWHYSHPEASAISIRTMPRRFRFSPRDPLVILVGALTVSGGSPFGVAPVEGQEPVRHEVPGLDFHPDGAWRRRAQSVRLRRESLLRARDYQSLNADPRLLFQRAVPVTGSATVVAGPFFVPVVLIAYSDVPVRFTPTQFNDVLFSSLPMGRAYSLRTFYEELSGGRITLNGRIFAPVTADTTALFYEDGCNGLSVVGNTSCPMRPVSRLGLLLTSVLDKLSTAAGGDTLWNRFDNDGPDGIPNSGDDDGRVDFVTFLQPNVGGECRRGATGIWSHRWVLSGVTGGTPYATRTPRRNGSGQVIPGAFLQIEDYTIQSQLGGDSACSGDDILPVGTIAHETGHAFGLPDLYDLTLATSGIGEWGLMGSGNFALPHSPATYEAWSLMQLGWITVAPLTEDRVITTGPRQLTDTIFLAESTDDPSTHLLIENRQAIQSDTAQMNPAFEKAKAPGLLLWRVNQNVVSSRLATINSAQPNGLVLLQADGREDLRRRLNRGDQGDSYPFLGGRNRLTLTTLPSATGDDGRFLGFVVDQIERLPGQDMRFRFTRRAPSRFGVERNGPTVRVNGLSRFFLEDLVPPGDTVTLEADSIVSFNNGRSMARFLEWTNGQPRSHTVISRSGPPDTVLARFTFDHRVKVTVAGLGAGAVVPSADVPIQSGAFVPEGTPITLTATPAEGMTFAGWTGDTTAIASALTLAVGRPFDLVATFTPTVAVTTADALQAVLGGTTLSETQRTFLDLLGNRNGAFDLGDYLALVRRGGAAASTVAPPSGAPGGAP